MPGGVPYETQPQTFVAPGGVTTCVVLGFPSRSTIHKIAIAQSDGGAVAFTAALYNNESACAGRPESASIGGDVLVFPPDLYRVTPDLAGVAGQLIYFAEDHGGHGFGFVNLDHPADQAGEIGNPRTIYLRITPAGGGDHTFAIVLGGDAYA